MTKAIHEIQSSAVDDALKSLIAIRPDLNTETNRALARLVAKEAVDNALRSLREEGHILSEFPGTTGAANMNNPKFTAAATPFGENQQNFVGIIDSLGRMTLEKVGAQAGVKPEVIGVITTLGSDLFKKAVSEATNGTGTK